MTLKFRLGLNTLQAAPQQQAADGFGRGFQALFSAPVQAAIAAGEAQKDQAQIGLWGSQQRQADAHTAHLALQTREKEDRLSRGALPELISTAALMNRVPLHQVPEVQQFVQSGKLPDAPIPYQPADGQAGPGMPLPEYAKPEGLGGQIYRMLGLLQGQLATGDSNIENLAKASGAFQRQDATRDMMANPGLAAIYGPAFAVPDSKPVFHPIGTTGRGYNAFTGVEQTLSPGVASLHDRGEQSQIDLRGAQAQRQRKLANAPAASPYGKPPAGYRFVLGDDGEATLEPIPGGPKDPSPAPPKPMPAAAVKLQNEELEAIGTAAGMNADLAALDKQIKDGKLQLGVISNLWNKGRNAVGMSDETSRNLASFQATLERMRNDSLRLAKGVQTEGDAQRAWNELITNIRDPGIVRQRLAEIQRLNQRAADLRQLQVETIRSNFGQPPLDTTGRTTVPAALGAGGPAVAPAAPAVQPPARRASASNW